MSGGLSYEDAKQQARSANAAVRAALAARADVPPEILAFLSGDPDARVRAAAAANLYTPMHTAGALSRDNTEAVRFALAGRIVRLLPELDAEGHKQAYHLATEALMALALDEALRVRESLSTALKDIAAAPPKVVRQLAYDTARAVAEPILRYCLLLDDTDLLNLIATRDASWLRAAIAARPQVSEAVSSAIVAKNDGAATGILLDNQGARIGAASWGALLQSAPAQPDWQAAMVRRSDLPSDILQKLAEFVDKTLLAILKERSDLDPLTRQQVVVVARRRLESQSIRESMPTEASEARAVRWFKNGILNEAAVLDALAMGDNTFARASLALMASVPMESLLRIIQQHNAKALTAVCWRAGFSMRGALQMQQKLARIPAAQLIYPRGGFEYPLTEAEMVLQLELYGVGG